MKLTSFAHAFKRAALRTTGVRLASATATTQVTKPSPKALSTVSLSAAQMVAIVETVGKTATAPVNHTQPTEAQAVAASWERAMQRATSQQPRL